MYVYPCLHVVIICCVGSPHEAADAVQTSDHLPVTAATGSSDSATPMADTTALSTATLHDPITDQSHSDSEMRGGCANLPSSVTRQAELDSKWIIVALIPRLSPNIRM